MTSTDPQLIAMLETMDINQLLDIAIERLRKINAANLSPTAAAPMAIPVAPIPTTLRSRR